VRDRYYEIMKQQKEERGEEYPEIDVEAIWNSFLRREGIKVCSIRKKLATILVHLYRAFSRKRLQLYPNVKRVLDELRPTYRMAIISDAQPCWALPEMKAVGLNGYFEPIIISTTYDDADAMIVLGVNEEIYRPESHQIASMASCTTNCLAPVARVLHEFFGVDFIMFTTVHAYTSSQSLMDTPARHRRRGRAAALSIIPTTTGAAKAAERVLPQLKGKMTGLAMRVPIPNVSVTDMMVCLGKDVTSEQVNAALQGAKHSAMKAAMSETIAKLLPVVIALIAMLSLSQIMIHAGMIAGLSAWVAQTAGGLWPLLCPLVGVLGTFVTGSATASNILFTEFQQTVAENLGLPVLSMLGAQGFGAAAGNITCPHNIIAGGATVGLVGKEGSILRKTMVGCLLYSTLGGLVVLWLTRFQ